LKSKGRLFYFCVLTVPVQPDRITDNGDLNDSPQ